MKRLRIAVIGAGHLGRIHAKLLRSLDQCELTAIVDTHLQAAQSLAQEHGCQAYEHHAALAGNVDLAVVATPTVFHFEVARWLLEQGVDVLIEKPISATLAEAETLVRLAEKHNRVLQIGHVERFNPAVAAAAEKTGRPWCIEASRTSGFTGRSTDIGVVLDLMIHDIDLVLSMVGPHAADAVQRIDAVGSSLMNCGEDIAQAWITFSSGCVAHLHASRVTPKAQREMQIHCDNGSALLDMNARTVQWMSLRDDIQNRSFDFEQLDAGQRASLKDDLFTDYLPLTNLPVADGNPLLEELVDFVQCVQQRRQPKVCGAQGRDALAIAEQVVAKIERTATDTGAARRAA